MKSVIALFLFATAALAADPYMPTDLERARWTMQDMKSWMIVFDAYKLDHKEYPRVTTPKKRGRSANRSTSLLLRCMTPGAIHIASKRMGRHSASSARERTAFFKRTFLKKGR
jgi:hypothetical protein